MGIAMANDGFFAPLNALFSGLADLLRGPAPAPRAQPSPAQVAIKTIAAEARPACLRGQNGLKKPPAARPVRVMRARKSGALVISGRMADVCAELDRLAAQERRQVF